jgi:hypothetical protein
MIVYNITIKIMPQIEKEWIQWQKEEHIPEIIGTGCFKHASVFRLLEADESDGITYVVQYFAENMGQYKRYIEEMAPVLRQKALDRWGNRFIAFRTVMQAVE